MMRTAPVVALAVVATVIAGCTAGGDGASSPKGSATATAQSTAAGTPSGTGASTGPAAAPLVIPSAGPGEVARASVILDQVTATAAPSAEAGSYDVEGACQGAAGSELVYRLTVAAVGTPTGTGVKEVTTGTLACDEVVYRSTATVVDARQQIRITLDAPPPGVTIGFVRVVPS
jgi:hypothetical protein